MFTIGSITSATIGNLAQYIGKIVSIKTTSMSIGRAKFLTVADPLVVTVVNADGSPFLDASGHQITRTVPLSTITAMWEYGVEQPPDVSGGGALTTLQASAMPPWLLPAGAVALGLVLLWRSGILAGIGIGSKKLGRKNRRSRGRRSKR